MRRLTFEDFINPESEYRRKMEKAVKGTYERESFWAEYARLCDERPDRPRVFVKNITATK